MLAKLISQIYIYIYVRFPTSRTEMLRKVFLMVVLMMGRAVPLLRLRESMPTFIVLSHLRIIITALHPTSI